MRPNHEYRKKTASKWHGAAVGFDSWHRRWYEHEIFIVSCTDNEYMYENYIATKKLMTNMTEKRRGEWLTERLLLGFMDLRRPRVSRHSTSVLFNYVMIYWPGFKFGRSKLYPRNKNLGNLAWGVKNGWNISVCRPVAHRINREWLRL